jgi:hypothetical protein
VRQAVGVIGGYNYAFDGIQALFSEFLSPTNDYMKAFDPGTLDQSVSNVSLI